MIPLADENPVRRLPVMTLLIIVACTAIFFLVQPTGKSFFHDLGLARVQRDDLEFSLRWAAIPCELQQGRPLTVDEARATFVRGNDSACGVGRPNSPAVEPDKNVYLAVLVSIFLHGSVAHLVGNMLFLWIFGNNIEDRRGRFGFAAFYLSAGLVAAAVQYVVNPDSTIPLIGASGAIAGVMGAYLVWFPNARIKSLIVFGPVLFRKVKAKWVLGLWFAEQFLLYKDNTTIAWMAHVGGFAFGVVVGWLWRHQEARAPAIPAPPA
jgi:membrane associated rhomboid family serine protease